MSFAYDSTFSEFPLGQPLSDTDRVVPSTILLSNLRRVYLCMIVCSRCFCGSTTVSPRSMTPHASRPASLISAQQFL
ncbi:hypothetical protein M408DRAFT_197457 [Serendipita vermifera MAFF 305830]|uniref:Uncharacterized protein n=1 Tax=Serendipita vermifera MAFF 305830 TaxID=933852 RepID=A0A0C3B418_SERVB|nr:hypothetical protein M408DRAFT_197457 [Serendipita vermifera MAFF 305830]